jgi:hypothetical protein
MKFEAKDVNGVATSTTIGTPWANITPVDARSKCQSLGPGFALISNAQWQAIARNIETVRDGQGNYLNWSNGSISESNFINMGHSDNFPNTLLAAGDDSDPCFLTQNPNCNQKSNSQFAQKRVHTLSNGEVIWDFSGNASEWVNDSVNFNYGGNTNCDTDFWALITATDGSACLAPACNGPQGRLKAAFGPIGDYTAKTTGNYGGLGQICRIQSGVSIHRGGIYNHGTGQTGIFGVSLYRDPSFSDGNISFRCTKVGESN